MRDDSVCAPAASAFYRSRRTASASSGIAETVEIAVISSRLTFPRSTPSGRLSTQVSLPRDTDSSTETGSLDGYAQPPPAAAAHESRWIRAGAAASTSAGDVFIRPALLIGFAEPCCGSPSGAHRCRHVASRCSMRQRCSTRSGRIFSARPDGGKEARQVVGIQQLLELFGGRGQPLLGPCQARGKEAVGHRRSDQTSPEADASRFRRELERSRFASG